MTKAVLDVLEIRFLLDRIQHIRYFDIVFINLNPFYQLQNNFKFNLGMSISDEYVM